MEVQRVARRRAATPNQLRPRKRSGTDPNRRVPPDVEAVRVWSYWTGPQPAWIGLCLETLRRNCPTATVLDDTVWTTLYDGSIPVDVILRQRPNVRSDVLRAWLLHRYGGIWVDADCIVWRDLRPIAGWLRTKDFVAYRVRLVRRRRRQLCSALIAARPGSEIAAAYWQDIEQKLAPGRKVRTFALGPGLLSQVRLIGVPRCHFLRTELVHPIHWKRRAVLTSPDEYTPRPGAWTFMLTHRSLGPLRRATRAQLLASDTMVGRLFRRALTTPVVREKPQKTPDSKPSPADEPAFDVGQYLKTIPYHAVSHRIAAVTCHFNPQNSESRRRCFATFSRQFPRIGLDLFVAEGSVDDRWEVPDGPNVWRFAMDPDALLFAKENLLNLAFALIPDRFDRVLWIDADVIPLVHDYADQLAAALDKYAVVQAFSTLRYLGPNGEPETGWRSGLAYLNAQRGTSTATVEPSYPGGIWAARRDLLSAVGGLYDRCVTGSGDVAWASAVYETAEPTKQMAGWSPLLVADVIAYCRRVGPLVNAVGLVPAQVVHLYHGKLFRRQYQPRHRTIRATNYDPRRHVNYAPSGTLRWSAAAPDELRTGVRDYILRREEDV